MSKVYDQYRVNEDGDNWYLKISDGSVYGPESYAVMSRWVAEGRVAPEDEVSQDGESWMPAANVTRFKMEWVAEFSDGSTYGPFNLLAVPNLLKTATFGPSTKLVNRVSGKSLRVDQVVKPGTQTVDVPTPVSAPVAKEVTQPPAAPVAAAPVSPPEAPAAEAGNAQERPLASGKTTDLSGPDFRQVVGDLESNVEALEGEKVRLESAAASFERERHEWERKFRVLESQNEKLTKKVSEQEEQYQSQAKWQIELREKGDRRINELQEAVEREKSLRASLTDTQGSDAAGKLNELTKHIESLNGKLSEVESRFTQERDTGAQLKRQLTEGEQNFQKRLKQLTSDLEAAKAEAAKKPAPATAKAGPSAEQLAEFDAAKTRARTLEQELAAKVELLVRREEELAAGTRKYDEACKRADESERAMHAFANNQKFSVKEAVDEALNVQALHHGEMEQLLSTSREQVKSAEARLASMVDELESLRAATLKAQSNCESHQNLLSSQDAEHARQTEEQQNLLKEAGSRAAALEASLAEARSLLAQKEKEQADLLHVRAELEQTVGQMQMEWQTSLKKLETVEKELSTVQASESKTSAQLVASRAAEENLTRTLDTLRAAEGKLSSQLTDSQSSEAKLTAAVASLQSQLTEQAAKHETEMLRASALLQEAEAARAQTTSLMADRDQLTQDLKQMRAELAAATRNVEAMSSEGAAKLAELDSMRVTVQQMETQRVQQVQTLEATLQERDATLARLTAESTREREWRAGVESRQAQTEAGFRVEVESLQMELKSHVAEQKATMAELVNARQRLVNMEKQLAEQSANWAKQVENLRTEVALHEGRVGDLSSELAMGQSLMSEVRRDKEEREKSLVHRIRELEDRERTSTAFLENATGEIRRIRSRCDSLETELNQVRDLELKREAEALEKAKLKAAEVKPVPQPEPIVDVPAATPEIVESDAAKSAPIQLESVPAPSESPSVPEPETVKVDVAESGDLKSEIAKSEIQNAPLEVTVVPEPKSEAESVSVAAPAEDVTPTVVSVEVVTEAVEVVAEPVVPVEVVAVGSVPVVEVEAVPEPVKDSVPVEEKKADDVIPAEQASAPVQATPEWYLKLDDGAIYGPVSEEDLKDWARQCRIAPHHEVSCDQKLWKLAGALSQLEMDWMVVTPAGERLGPFHRDAIRDLLADGGVDSTATVSHRDGGQEQSVGEFCQMAKVNND